MAYKTGNPVGSTDPRDLFDNAGILDQFANGPAPFYPDRFAVQRLSLSGIRYNFDQAQTGRQAAFDSAQALRAMEFNEFLTDSAFVSMGNYAAGLQFDRYNQYVAYGGNFYRPVAGSIPFTTSGTWEGADEELFSLFSEDNALRQDLGMPGGAGIPGFNISENYRSNSVGSTLQGLVSAISKVQGTILALDSFMGANDQEKLEDALAAALEQKLAIYLPARPLEVTQTLVYDTAGRGTYQGLQLIGPGQLSCTFVNKINNSGVGGPVLRLTSGTASADQQHGGLISGVGCINDGAGTNGHFIEYQGTWHQTFERLYADGLTGAALRCINLWGDADSSAHVNIRMTRFLECEGGAWNSDGGTGGVSVHTLSDFYSVNCGSVAGAQLILDGVVHLRLSQCSITGQGEDAPNVPLVKIKNTNLRSRTINIEGGEYGNNGGTHFEIAAVNTFYAGGFRHVRRPGETNSTRGFDFADGNQLHRNVHIGPVELAIDNASPPWTWVNVGTGAGGNFTIDPPNNDSFASGNILYAGGGISKVSIRDTENSILVSEFASRVRTSYGTPGAVNLNPSTGLWQQAEFVAGGAYTVGAATAGVRDGQEFDLTIINSVNADVSFAASMLVTGYTNNTTEKSATFRYDGASTRWKQIGGWS